MLVQMDVLTRRWSELGGHTSVQRFVQDGRRDHNYPHSADGMDGQKRRVLGKT